MDQDALKRQAAEHAVRFIESGMIVGLGEGSTAIWAVRHIAHRLQAGDLHDILGIPCSLHIEQEARKLGIPITTLEEHPTIDLTIDGADEVNPDLDLIKGGGGALMREKIVAQATRREIIVVDETKMVPALGTHWAVPIEVIPFGYGSQMHYLKSIGAVVKIRQNKDGTPFKTDQGNLIMDSNFGAVPNPAELAEKLKRRTGIAEHGLFIRLASDVIVAGSSGIQHIQREPTH